MRHRILAGLLALMLLSVPMAWGQMRLTGPSGGVTVSTALTDSANLARKTDNLSVFAATTSAQLRGVLSDPTGTGAAVFADSPTFTTKILVPDGAVGAPAIGFSGHPTDGMYSAGAADIRWTLAGVVRAVLNSSFGGNLQAVTLGIGLNGDLVLSRFAANNLQLGPAATATPASQTLSVQDGAGTDIAGATWTLRASRGTGAGAPGTGVLAASAAALGTGTTLQTAVAHLTWGNGSVKLGSSVNLQQSNGTVRITDGGVFRSSDNSAGFTGTCTVFATVKDGIITAC